MRVSAFGWGIVVAILGASAVASAQLGEVARREEERRKTVKSSGKVYTNDSLKPDTSIPTTAPPPSSGDQSSSNGSASGGTAAAPPDPSKDESHWRDRIRSERQALERTRVLADALQSRVNALNTDFVNRDDPAQRSVIAANRQKALAELERLTREVDLHTKAISDIQDEARRAGIPAGWVR